MHTRVLAITDTPDDAALEARLLPYYGDPDHWTKTPNAKFDYFVNGPLSRLSVLLPHADPAIYQARVGDVDWEGALTQAETHSYSFLQDAANALGLTPDEYSPERLRQRSETMGTFALFGYAFVDDDGWDAAENTSGYRLTTETDASAVEYRQRCLSKVRAMPPDKWVHAVDCHS